MPTGMSKWSKERRADWYASRERHYRHHARTHQAKFRGHAAPPVEEDCPPRPADDRCQCCGRVQSPLDLDHDHYTGEFRGWLCMKCNTGIGFLGDLPGGVHAALEYLRRVYRDKPEPWDR